MSNDNTNTNSIPQMLPGDARNLRVHVGGDTGPNIGTGDGNVTTSSSDTNISPTSVEFLDVAASQSLTHAADVQSFPPAETFVREIEGHNKAIAEMQSKLDEKHFDPRTGQVKGNAYEGEARRILELQLNSRKGALSFTQFNLQRAHQAAEVRAAKAAQDAANDQPSDATSVQEAVRREQLIAATANDIGADGKPLGRVKATQLVDDELARSRVAARVKASR